MGMSKKVEDAKQQYLLLCQQYNRLGAQRAAEVRAIAAKDAEGWEAAATSLNAQYKEMGNQMMVLGRALDNFGGVSVLHGPVNLTPVTSGRVSADKPNPSAPGYSVHPAAPTERPHDLMRLEDLE